jgi:hypothetical protein
VNGLAVQLAVQLERAFEQLEKVTGRIIGDPAGRGSRFELVEFFELLLVRRGAGGPFDIHINDPIGAPPGQLIPVADPPQTIDDGKRL